MFLVKTQVITTEESRTRITKDSSNYNKSVYVLLVLSMLYVAFKLTCNPMFFRQTIIKLPLLSWDLKIVCSAFVFPAIYVMSDVITALSNRKLAITIIIIGAVCDGIFSFAVDSITSLRIPNNISGLQALNTQYINHLGPQVWSLYYHGVIASVVTAIVEVFIFSFVLKKSKNFFIATITGVIITLLIHNTITDYPLLRLDPDAWKIIFNGIFVNVSIMVIYASIVSTILWLIKKEKIILN